MGAGWPRRSGSAPSRHTGVPARRSAGRALRRADSTACASVTARMTRSGAAFGQSGLRGARQPVGREPPRGAAGPLGCLVRRRQRLVPQPGDGPQVPGLIDGRRGPRPARVKSTASRSPGGAHSSATASASAAPAEPPCSSGRGLPSDRPNRQRTSARSTAGHQRNVPAT